MDQELSSVLSDFKKLDKRISKVATTAVCGDDDGGGEGNGKEN